MKRSTKQLIAAIAVTAAIVAAAGWLLGDKPVAAQGDYPRTIIMAKEDAVNGGLPKELAVDNHGVPLGNAVSTFNAAQGSAIGRVGYAIGQGLPAWTQQIGEQVHITGTAATTVKATTGVLIGLTVNTPAVGTVSIFDLAGAGCTGTPSTNTVAVVTVAATTQPQPISYGAHMLNGICVKASVAMDLTAVYQ